MPKRKNPAAVSLGRKGGLARAATVLEAIPPKERHAYASYAARVRWAKARAAAKAAAKVKKPTEE
ncbi:MAG TPA: hypothetical protein VKE26_26275 [Xanthobacteraceae bacterium]|nr:hypothetical protein [Xanthobacteraceae bacterium]